MVIGIWLCSFIKKADYTVNNAKKVDGDYYVVVDIRPIDFFDISYEVAASYAQEYGSGISEDEYAGYTDADWDKWENSYAEGLLEVLTSYLDKISYGDVISLNNKLIIEDNVYGIDDDDIYKIDDYVLGLIDENDSSEQ